MIYKIGSAVVNMYNVKAVEPVYDFGYCGCIRIIYNNGKKEIVSVGMDPDEAIENMKRIG